MLRTPCGPTSITFRARAMSWYHPRGNRPQNVKIPGMSVAPRGGALARASSQRLRFRTRNGRAAWIGGRTVDAPAFSRLGDPTVMPAIHTIDANCRVRRPGRGAVEAQSSSEDGRLRPDLCRCATPLAWIRDWWRAKAEPWSSALIFLIPYPPGKLAAGGDGIAGACGRGSRGWSPRSQVPGFPARKWTAALGSAMCRWSPALFSTRRADASPAPRGNETAADCPAANTVSNRATAAFSVKPCWVITATWKPWCWGYWDG